MTLIDFVKQMRFNVAEEVPSAVLWDVIEKLKKGKKNDGTLGKYLKSIGAELQTVSVNIGHEETGLFLMLSRKEQKARMSLENREIQQ